MNAGKLAHQPAIAVLLSASCLTGPIAARQDAAVAGPPRVTTITTSRPLSSQGRLGGVSVDQMGRVFVSNFGATVWRVAPDGGVTVLAQDLRGSSGNAVDRDGNLYQASFLDGRIVRFTPDGSRRDFVPSGLQGPIGLAIAQDGSVYVCACRSNSIARRDPRGAVSDYAQHPDLDCPNGITIGPDEALYVVSFNNEYVVRVDSAGRAARFSTVPGGRNAHIAFAAGALWVTKIETHTVYRVTTDGRAERYAGTGEPGFEDGAVAHASLAHPNGVAVMPGGGALVVNTLDGEWRGESPTRIVLRRIELPATQAGVQR